MSKSILVFEHLQKRYKNIKNIIRTRRMKDVLLKTSIRYRAWHRKDKKMGTVIQLSLGDGGEILGGLVDFNGNECIQLLGEEMIVMLSTYLQDKNGIEIYAGDRVTTGVVEWFDSCFIVRAGDETWERLNANEQEVIGHIYENSN